MGRSREGTTSRLVAQLPVTERQRDSAANRSNITGAMPTRRVDIESEHELDSVLDFMRLLSSIEHGKAPPPQPS